MKTLIGIDYGTESARAILLDPETKKIITSHTVSYPHGVFGEGYADTHDYENTLFTLLEAVTPKEFRNTIAGICVDATSLTLVCTQKNGKALALDPELSERKHAQIKLWKCHSAQPYAEKALALAKKMGEPFLRRTGGSISSEWTLPKLLEIKEKDPTVYSRIDAAFDLCEYLTYRLTGKITRSSGAMSFKALWAPDLGFPSEQYLNSLSDGFANEYKYFLRGPVFSPGQAAGTLNEEIRERFSLPEGITVAAGTLDGHTAIVALGALNAKDAALVVGTSNVLTIQTEALHEIDGICGIALNGLTHGLYGIDSGQSCTGDMLKWFTENSLPDYIYKEAEDKGMSVHSLLCEKIKDPQNCSLCALDFFNGSRNTPCDLTLRGAVMGLSISTKPEDIYLALLQAIVCGTREIIEECKKHGVAVNRVVATGGITAKNPLLMQQYAEILDLPVLVGKISEGPAYGAALFAAVACGMYNDARDAYDSMGVKEFTEYRPTHEHREAYERIYSRNKKFRRFIAEFEKQED